MLTFTGSPSALHPPPTEQTLAVDAAAKAESAAPADSTIAGAAADADPAEVVTAGEAANTLDAEIATAPAAADTADAVPADVITTSVAACTADAATTDITTAGAASACTADAVLAENTRKAAAAAANTATIEAVTVGGSAGNMNLLSQVFDQAAGEADAGAAKTQMDHTHSHVSCCKPVSMADELHEGSPAAFIATAAFSGAKAGMLFKTGTRGLGYYADAGGLAPEAPTSLSTTMFPTSTASCVGNVSAGLSSQVPLVKQVVPIGTAVHTGQKEGEAREGDSEGRYEAGVNGQVKGEGVGGKADEGDKNGHYWGQALQYLDRSIQVCHSL